MRLPIQTNFTVYNTSIHTNYKNTNNSFHSPRVKFLNKKNVLPIDSESESESSRKMSVLLGLVTVDPGRLHVTCA